MTDETKKPDHLKLVPEEELDEEEREFRAIRQDVPGVKGASAIGIVIIGVSKTPGKHEFFRTHPDFHPVVPMVDCEVGMEKRYLPVTPQMIEPLATIGISVTLHTLYLTVTSRGAVRIVPVRHADAEGNQNEYDRTGKSVCGEARTNGCGFTLIRRTAPTWFSLLIRAASANQSGQN
jgi:hypothetical protein